MTRFLLLALMALRLQATVYYVRSTDGSDSDNGSTWALAKATLASAFSAANAAGDIIYVSQSHAESDGTAQTFTPAGTVGNPVRILCANDGAEPPTTLATTCTVSTTTTNAIAFGAGYAYVYGIGFVAGSGSSTANIQFGPANTVSGWEFDSCKFTLGNSSTSSRIVLGQTTSGISEAYLVWRNTTLKFGSTSQTMQTRAIRWKWLSTPSAIDSGGSIPTTLFTPVTLSPAPPYVIAGVDFSQVVTGKSLVNLSSAVPQQFDIRNCRLGSGYAVTTGTISGPGGVEVFLDNCHSGDNEYNMEHYRYQGSIKTEATVVRTGGASDGTTTISHKMTTLSTGPSLFTPLEGPRICAWNDTIGSSVTATLEIIHDSVTALTDAEVWGQVESLNTSGYPLSTFTNDRVASAVTSAANQASSSATWTTSGLTNPNTQKLEVTFTPQEKGPVCMRAVLAKSNYTVYVDPKLTIQ